MSNEVRTDKTRQLFAPGGGRTHSLWLRRPTLCPIELRARADSEDNHNLLIWRCSDSPIPLRHGAERKAAIHAERRLTEDARQRIMGLRGPQRCGAFLNQGVQLIQVDRLYEVMLESCLIAF